MAVLRVESEGFEHFAQKFDLIVICELSAQLCLKLHLWGFLFPGGHALHQHCLVVLSLHSDVDVLSSNLKILEGS